MQIKLVLYFIIFIIFHCNIGLSSNSDNGFPMFINKVKKADKAQEDASKIIIQRNQILLLSPQDETIMKMFDGDVTTSWFPGWNAVYPAAALVDLKGTFVLSKFRFANYLSERHFLIYGGKDPVNLKLLVDQNVQGYMSWIEFQLNAEVNYLKFEIPGNKTDSPVELEIYGTKIADALSPLPQGQFAEQNTVNGIFGVNSFHWIDPNKETSFLSIREYVDTDWIEQTDGNYRYNPTTTGAGMLDDHYAQLKNMGIEVIPCLKGNLLFTRTDDYPDSEFKPVFPHSANPSDPNSYLKQAEFNFQFAARYGYAKVPLSLVKIDSTPRWTQDVVNVKKSGLGYIKYFESWNEPDKNWKGVNGFFSPFEFAAYMSAVSDGHCNTMGPGVGIKNADPTAKVVMGGLANVDLEYIKAMVLWFQINRIDHQIPIDVFNFHHYSNSSGVQNSASSVGISPEDDKIRDLMKTVKTYIDTYLPGKEIFLSEYGYDSNIGSLQRSPAVGAMSIREVQGIWNTRTMLELMASQIDKSHLFMIYDEVGIDDNYGTYANSGVLTSEYIGYQKKPAWFYLNTLKQVLKDYKFVADESPDSSIRKYKFSKDSKSVYAIWLTSSTDAKLNYALNIPGVSSADIITLTDNSEEGTKSTVPISASTTIAISERPIFIVYTEPVVINNVPAANAGRDTSVALPNNSVILFGSGKETDGYITNYSWTQLTGPSAATLGGVNTATLSAGNFTAGTYVFRLAVTDNKGSVGTDDVSIVISPTGISGLNYAYYEGNFNSLPDFNFLTPKKTGIINDFSITPRNSDNSYAFTFDGYIDIATPGLYSFYTISDDGSKLYIDGIEVVSNDYLQPATERSGTINLTPGKKAISVNYFQGTGGWDLEVWYMGPGISKQVIPGSVLYLTESLFSNSPPIANAGTDITINLPINTKTLTGSGTDTDGTIASYAWSQITGASAALLSGINTASLTASNLVVGFYIFQLSVTDNNGSTGVDTIALFVDPPIGTNGLRYSYYEGEFGSLPDFSSIFPIKTGITSGYSISLKQRDDQFAFKFDGFINITTPGLYKFYTVSDDGSKLNIEGAEIVNNNYLQGPTEREGTVNLSSGKKAITVTYFQQSGGAFLEVWYMGPGIEKQLLPNTSLFVNQAAPRLSSNSDHEGNLSDVFISPNPAKEFIFLRVNGNLQHITYSIVDVVGKTMYQAEASNISDIEIPLNVHGFAPGLYFLKIYSKFTEVKIIKFNKE